MLSKGSIVLLAAALSAQPPILKQTCSGCHNPANTQGGLDLSKPLGTDRWIRIHDRIAKHEMPPQGSDLDSSTRAQLLKQISKTIEQAEPPRIPLRRLTRDEYEQTLRDLFHMPYLDIRDMLPEDRVSYHFHKSAESLDISRVQLSAYLDASEAALRQAISPSGAPSTKFRAVGTALFQTYSVLTIDEAMFFAKDSKRVKINKEEYAAAVKSGNHDPTLEMCLFRSPGWPYAAFPLGFAAAATGEYRVRFSARAVLQTEGFNLKPAHAPVSMVFRSRRPSSHDIAEDVRATGGILDLQPQPTVQETIVYLKKGQTIEYGLYGLPVPLIDAIPGKPGTYRYPPFPTGGQPGAAFQWLEIEGPLPAPAPPTLIDKSDPSLQMRRFIKLASTRPVAEEVIGKYVRLVHSRIQKGESPEQALLAGYQAFLSSETFLYLDPEDLSSRLSYFLTNSRPTFQTTKSNLRTHAEQLIAAPTFERFVKLFSDDWLNLSQLRREDADIRLFPEYRFDDYLVDSMDRETRTFLTALFRENLPITSLIDTKFVYANSRLAEHYKLQPMEGAALRRVTLPPESPYGGLLTQGSILKVTSNGTNTSPVIRGAWVMDRLLGQPPPPPPPGVPAVEPDIRGAKSIRDLLALHTRSATCASCHATFDPVGLALESFDVMGAHRTHYRGLSTGQPVSGIDRAGHGFSYTLSAPVDASGVLQDGRRFKDIRELKSHLASNPRQLAKNFLEQLAIYSTGSPVRFSSRKHIDKILDENQATDFRAKDLLLDLIESPIFTGKQ